GDLDPDLKILNQMIDGRAPKALVVFLAVHGGADSDGPFLVPQGSSQADPRDRARGRGRLTEVLDRLQKWPDTRMRLFLDCSQLSGSWPLGMFHSDFARMLKELRPRLDEFPNLIVLSASDEDQRSWVGEEWGQTVFTHYVLEGLRGAADANQDRRVTVLELYNYVHAKVKHWARHATTATPCRPRSSSATRGWPRTWKSSSPTTRPPRRRPWPSRCRRSCATPGRNATP